MPATESNNTLSSRSGTPAFRRHQGRRDFLKTTAMLGAGAATLEFWEGSPACAAESPNEKLNVAAIGVGDRGSDIGHAAGQLGNMVACCDVDQDYARRFAAKYDGRCAIYGDYRKLLERKDIDVVTIGTPDHWHAAIAIAALETGRDVYCEKPLTLTIAEGKLICRAVRKTGRVFQVGTQQRSDKKFLTAVALARSGRLGSVLTATCCLGKGATGGPFETSNPRASLDWDFWLGQAPKVDFTKERCRYTFRNWLEYSGGVLTDWGAHHVDIAQWGLGQEHSGPSEIEGAGQYSNLPENFDPVAFFAGEQKLANGYNVVTGFKVNLAFATGARMIVQSELLPDGQRPDSGVLFSGDKGEIFVSRSHLRGALIDELTETDQRWLDGEVDKLNKGMPQHGHMANFFECVKARKEPVSDVWSHHRAVSSCHLSNLAMLLKRKLRWDPEREAFLDDPQANALLDRPRRKGYELGA
jgi:predicted dehydrogenase